MLTFLKNMSLNKYLRNLVKPVFCLKSSAFPNYLDLFQAVKKCAGLYQHASVFVLEIFGQAGDHFWPEQLVLSEKQIKFSMTLN